MSTIPTLHDLFLHELSDLYSAENQLVKALPKMAKAATNAELKEAFETHLEETKGHVERLERVFKSLDEKPKRISCKAMKGLIEEGSEVLKADMPDEIRDAALIAAANKVEHYEIAGYGTVAEVAKMHDHGEALDLLLQTLDEEKHADGLLTRIATQEVNTTAEEVKPVHEVMAA